jgi:hypothetical protein
MTTRTATVKPDDKPFDFNLDAVKAEVDLTPWRVHWGGKRFEFRTPRSSTCGSWWRVPKAATSVQRCPASPCPRPGAVGRVQEDRHAAVQDEGPVRGVQGALWSGGIGGLVRLVREHGGAVEADLRQYYGVRLRDLFIRDSAGRRKMTWREFGAYVRQLPADARTRLAVGDMDGIWGLQEHLTAVVIDELRMRTGSAPTMASPRGSSRRTPSRSLAREQAARASGPPGTVPQRQEARQRALRRAADRRQGIASGHIQ